MSPKRKVDQEEGASAREKKKLKVAFARTIDVQTLAAPSTSSNAVAGPSQAIAAHPSMQGLPATLDVEKFTEARAFEINAMEKAMQTASASSTQRAWQTLPRHLRRRAASHDVRRVPLRLREKAQSEMDPAKRKPLGKSTPKRGKNNRVSRTESFLRRQRDKTWLETHIWHAKRMHMDNLWGYRLAITPTEKAFRPSHRAAIHGSILHDASYYSLIECTGPENILRKILESCCDPQGQGPGAPRFIKGARTLETHIYKPGRYPFDHIGPVAVIWKPTATPEVAAGSETDVTKTSTKESKKSRKGKEKAITDAPTPSDPYQLRSLWIRSHPATHQDVFDAFQLAASTTLDEVRQLSSGGETAPDLEVEITDMKSQINVFEIMGPKANQVLKGALSPVSEDSREEFWNFWKSLTDLQSSGSVPRNMVIGFKVQDPRLKFPPKNAKAKIGDATNLSTATTFPSATLAQSEIWDESTREALQKPRYKKKDLDERRSKNLVPGEPLKPLRRDDRVPVLLIQRSLEAPTSLDQSQAIHGWTLIVPAGWSMPFFSSLTFTGTRVGGQRERQHQSFEAGCLYFPRDLPFTPAYQQHVHDSAVEEEARWERKPPAKRSNWEKLGTRSPWQADWKVVLGITSIEDPVDLNEPGLVSTQHEAAQMVEHDVQPWLLRGPDVPVILTHISELFDNRSGLLAEINKLRVKRGRGILNTKADDLWKGALVSVRLRMCGRGAPDDLAVIYEIADEEALRWLKIHRKIRDNGSFIEEEPLDEMELTANRPSQSSIIGYVTSGNFSLARGEGFSLGAVSLSKIHELRAQASRLKMLGIGKNIVPNILVKVRDRDGEVCRAAYIEVMGN